MGWAIEPRKIPVAGAEAVDTAEGNMSSTVMRGAAALPWSKTPSRTKGSRRNLGDLMPTRSRSGGPGSRREAGAGDADDARA